MVSIRKRLCGIETAAVILFGVVFGAVYALIKGQDINWDLRNYHYYNVFAWLTGTIWLHIAPAQQQSWLNPLAYLPHYLLIKYTNPILAGATFGAVGGLNFAMVYALTRVILHPENPLLAIFIAVVCSVIAITGPEFLQTLGTTYSDSIVSLFVLGGLLPVCWAHSSLAISKGRHALPYWIGGLMLGAASGLKLTGVVYAAALTVSLLLLCSMLRLSIRQFAFYSLGSLLGFLLTGGYWSWLMWNELANPFFPYWNEVFRSPWTIPDNFRDARFPPQTFGAALSFPFQWFVGLHPTAEGPFRDGRFALLFVALAIAIVAVIIHRLGASRAPEHLQRAPRRLVQNAHCWLLFVFFVASYIIGTITFAIQRYLMPLGLLSGVLLFFLLDRFFSRSAPKALLFTALSLFLIVWNRPIGGERIPYGTDWFGMRLGAVASMNNTLFVMLGNAPMGYVVPFLPGSSRVVRIAGNMPLEPDTLLAQKVTEAVTRHSGPLRSLSASELSTFDYDQLKRFSLGITEKGCVTFASRFDQFTSCPLRRISSNPNQDSP